MGLPVQLPVDKKKFLLIYPAVLAIGTLVNLLIPHGWIVYGRSLYWFSSRNSINRIFAYNGNLIFLILFPCITLSRLREQNYRWKKNTLVEYVVKFFTKQISLYILFFIIDRLFLYTGGACHVQPSHVKSAAERAIDAKSCNTIYGIWQEGTCVLTATRLSRMITDSQVCRRFGKWHGGFDISGHFCFIVTLSTVFWFELINFTTSCDLESLRDSKLKKSTVILQWVLLIVLAIWIQMLFITAVFYHSFIEKVLGLLFGYITPFMMYYLIPKYIPTAYIQN